MPTAIITRYDDETETVVERHINVAFDYYAGRPAPRRVDFEDPDVGDSSEVHVVSARWADTGETVVGGLTADETDTVRFDYENDWDSLYGY